MRLSWAAVCCLLAACGGGGGDDAAPTVPAAPKAVLTTISVTLSVSTLQVGQTATAIAAGLDQFNAPFALGGVAWSSSNTAIATVTAGGQVNAVAAGQAQIVASSESKSGQAALTVMAADSTPVISFFSEEIPGSKNHTPNGTWWGYNQGKIVRYGNIVFMYVIENANLDTNPNPNVLNPSRFRLYKKEGSGSWQGGAAFNASRPGNLLVDSRGVLHAIVFEPTSTSDNGSFGKLRHYWFPGSINGDITNSQGETIVDNNGTTDGETVNIRVGAAIGSDDRMAVAFGLATKNSGQTEQMYYKGTADAAWTPQLAGTNLGHDFYYPYVVVSGGGFSILSVQDEFMGTGQANLYQMVQYFESAGATWNNETIVDLRTNPAASTRPTLTEPSDLYSDAHGTVHVLYYSKTDPSDASHKTFTHKTRTGGGWTAVDVIAQDKYLDWMRMIEIGGVLYYVAVSNNNVYVKKGDAGALVRLNGLGLAGAYLYVASPSRGTRTTENYVDLLLLNGNSSSYPNAKNYYIRIDKSEFLKLK